MTNVFGRLSTAVRSGNTPHDDVLADVADLLERLRFGSVTLTVHEGRVTQLDVTEKRRFPA